MQIALSSNVRIKKYDLVNKRRTVISEWIIFLIHPLSALILAFGNFRSSYAKNILWIFVAYYGFTIVISDTGRDANRYRDSFIALSESKASSENFVKSLYVEESTSLDIIEPLISFSVSRLTNDPRFLFAVFGLVFGYFYSRNIWILLERVGERINRSSIIYLVVFAILIGFWQINGFRFWTAAQVFFFGTIKYLLENKKTGILIAATSVFFHFSFIFPVSLFLIYITLPKKVSLLYWFFVVTFFISEVNVTQIGDVLTNFLPGIFHRHIQGYTSLDYVEAISEDLETRNWRFFLYGKSIKWASTAFMSVIYFSGIKYIKEIRNYNVLFCFALFFLAFVNLFNSIPSFHRFYLVAYLFAFALIFLYLQNAPDFRFKKFTLIILFPLLIFFCIGQINISFSTIGLLTLFGNPISAVLPFGAAGDAAIQSFLE